VPANEILLGELKGLVTGLDKKIDSLAESHVRIEQEQTDARRRLHERIEEIIDRIAKVEPLIDRVDGIANATLEHEQWRADFLHQCELDEAKKKRDRYWLGGLGSAVAATLGDHWTGSRLVKIVSGWFGAGH
jgi:hypothetical protein